MRLRVPPLVVLLGLGALGIALPAAATDATLRTVAYSARTMGTVAGVILVTADSARSAPDASAARRTFQRVDSLMSNWTTTSEVARLNRDAWPNATPVEPEVARVLTRALAIGRDSDGAFDVTVEPIVRAWGFLGGAPDVPSDSAVTAAFARVGSDKLEYDPAGPELRFREQGVRIDLGGIAKGYAVDVAADSLRRRGVTDALIDLSGNMAALGHPPGATGWRIGVRDPRDRMPWFARLVLHDEAIATSGKYEQFVASNGKTYGHIIDPRTGRPAEGLISVTVIAASAMTADAWGTALFVLGPDAAKQKARERDDIAAILVTPGDAGVDTVWVERPIAERVHLVDEANRYFRIRTF